MRTAICIAIVIFAVNAPCEGAGITIDCPKNIRAWRPNKVVISSTGEAAYQVGGMLGQYELVRSKDYYIQTNTNNGQAGYRSTYLYHDARCYWWVSNFPNKPGYMYGSMSHPNPSQTLQKTGNFYGNTICLSGI